MKKLILAGVIAGSVLVAVTAYAKPKHPNLHAAHELVVKAMARIDDAQKANEYDLGGHAAKAKDLLTQAEAELKQAAEEANDNGKK